MSEDEALLRGTIDRPGDDTARLVYADWLDERDDPRGAFLRTELKAVGRKTRKVRQRDLVRVAAYFEKVDLLWAMRVSRPPVGVCSEHIRFTDCGPALARNELERLPFFNRIDVPHAAFLLNFNGGRPEKPSVHRWHYEIALERFFRADELRYYEFVGKEKPLLAFGSVRRNGGELGLLYATALSTFGGEVWIDFSPTGPSDAHWNPQHLSSSISYLLADFT